MRIIVAAAVLPTDVAPLRRELRVLARDFGFALGASVRVLNPRYFLHCHNKLIVRDGRSVLIGSQNWSDTAIGKNREASLLVDYPALAARYDAIFRSDWESALHAVPARAALRALPATAAARGVRTVTLDAGDYELV